MFSQYCGSSITFLRFLSLCRTGSIPFFALRLDSYWNVILVFHLLFDYFYPPDFSWCLSWSFNTVTPQLHALRHLKTLPTPHKLLDLSDINIILLHLAAWSRERCLCPWQAGRLDDRWTSLPSQTVLQFHDSYCYGSDNVYSMCTGFI